LPSVPPPAPVAEEPATPAPPAGPGYFKVNSRPWSEVWVDGQRIGQTGVPSFEVPAGPHTIRLVQPDSGQERTYANVEVPLGATVNVGCWDFELQAACR